MSTYLLQAQNERQQSAGCRIDSNGGWVGVLMMDFKDVLDRPT
jgi:hypothetical protein